MDESILCSRCEKKERTSVLTDLCDECEKEVQKEMGRYKKSVSVKDFDELKTLANEMFGQLELMDYEKKAKETYDDFKKELAKFEEAEK